ncbi:MAG: hypothetical protein ACRD0K_05620 [Egibacteraceae bacterium]
MIAALLTASAGLAGPWIVGWLTRRGSSPRLAIAAQLAGLLLAWGGVLAVVGKLVAPEEGMMRACGIMLSVILSGESTIATTVAAFAYLLLPGRGLGMLARTTWAVRRAAVALKCGGTVEDRVFHVPRLSTVAVTAGLLRPIIAVNAASFRALGWEQRSVVLAHERAHARSRHALVDAVARILAAGLAPWPGARVALAEVHRNLEAAADDRAASAHDRKTVALTIAEVATGARPVVGALGASGWPVWRVERLLRDRPTTAVRVAILLAALGVSAALVVGGQATLHVLAGAHFIETYCPFY